MANTNYLTGSLLGAYLAATTTDQKFALGAQSKGTNGSEWLYVYAGSNITQYDVVGVGASGTAVPVTAALAAAGQVLGIAQIAFTSGDYGWVATEGLNLRVNTNAAVAVGVALYTTDSAGKVDDLTASSSHWQIQGLFLIATASGSTASSAACTAKNMVVRKPAA